MLPSSHVVPTKSAGPVRLESPRQLADAFSEFISASAQLEASYRDLQQEVSHLSLELAERNAALTRSLAENDRMRKVLQQMIDSMPCGVLVLDSAEAVVTINPEARRLLALGTERPQTIFDLSRLTGIQFESLGAGFWGGSDAELCRTQQGEKRWLAIGRRELQSGSSAHESSGRPLRSIWLFRDITVAKQAEQEREVARRAATLAEISTILAHEIRNPLASLELFAGLIAEENGGHSEWIAHLRAGIRTMSGTVNNVLSMNGASTRPLVAVDLVGCIRGGVEFVRPVADEAGVFLSFETAETTLMIDGNEDAIRQIVLNLVSNAIRHTPAGGRVEIATRRAVRDDHQTAVVEVRDTGCGIPEEHLGQLFDPGFSGTGETPGLGLAVCRRLMAGHKGAIRVSSRVGEGSNFQLEFPAR